MLLRQSKMLIQPSRASYTLINSTQRDLAACEQIINPQAGIFQAPRGNPGIRVGPSYVIRFTL